MIERHEYLLAVPDDTVIWRYMPIKYFEYLLEHRFSHMDFLEDMAEVLVSNVEKEYWRVVLLLTHSRTRMNNSSKITPEAITNQYPSFD